MTLTEARDSTVYLATMEDAYSSFENEVFLNISATKDGTGGGNFTPDGSYAARLNPNEEIIGPAKMLVVSASDTVDLEVYAKYPSSFTSTGSGNNTTIAAALAGAFGATGGGASLQEQGVYNALNNNSGSFLASVANSGSSSVPKAYLNYVFFDQDFNFISGSSGYVAVSSAAEDVHELLEAGDLVMPSAGYLYVYVSNEGSTASGGDVYFDDLRITHKKGHIIQEDHYYPFGANISALSSSAPLSKPNKYKFNGIEQNTDFDLNTYDAFYRNYDPTLGRWWQVDPKASERESPYVGMGNNPILYNDYLGDTVKYANDDATRALQEQYSALRKQSKSFNTVLTLLEQSEVVVNIKVDEAAVDKVAEDKGLGESKEKVGGFADRSDNSITMRGGQSDKALAEEAFHVFQFITYGDERNTAEIESEAKLFDYDVVNEAADSRGDGFAFGPGGAESDITFVQFSQEDTGSRIIRGGSNRKAYNNYLKSFSRYQNSTGGAYKGTIRPLIPKAYNNVNTVQKINPRIRP